MQSMHSLNSIQKRTLIPSASCRSCDRPWGAWRRPRLRCTNTQHWSIFSTSADLRPRCKVTAQQRQLLSFYCKSAQKGCASASDSHPDHRRLLSWARLCGLFSRLFHYSFKNTQSAMEMFRLFIYFCLTQVQEWGNRVCCGLSDRVCVCLCVCVWFPEGGWARGWAGLRFWASALNTADQWITRAKAAVKVQPVTGRAVDPSSPSFCRRTTSRLSAAARSDASVWETAAAASSTPPRWDIKCF